MYDLRRTMYNTHDGPVAAGGKCGWAARMRCPDRGELAGCAGESLWGVPTLAHEFGEANTGDKLWSDHHDDRSLS